MIFTLSLKHRHLGMAITSTVKHNGQYEQAEHGTAGADHRGTGRGKLDPGRLPHDGRSQEHGHEATGGLG
jgi:hypothetical protein